MRLKNKIEDLVTDMHKKFAKFLCDNYNYILISRLNFHHMKKLDKKNKQKLMAYRHCEFVDRLKNKATQYTNCQIVEVPLP